jgi:hypothetical protein
MAKDEIETWLKSKLTGQINSAKLAMNKLTINLDQCDWRAVGETHREIDYFLSRCKNTQRLIDELDEVTK